MEGIDAAARLCEAWIWSAESVALKTEEDPFLLNDPIASLVVPGPCCHSMTRFTVKSSPRCLELITTETQSNVAYNNQKPFFNNGSSV